MNAFVLIHFGDKIKYLELEILFCINLRKYTDHDIIYLYSVNDTPASFVTIMEKYCTYIVPYDDNNITYNIKFNSIYSHFNILRTCNFIFAYKLVQYQKICILESDMIIMQNMDDIFDLRTPSMLVYRDNILDNYRLYGKNIDFASLNTNGGVMVIKPSLIKFREYLKNIKHVIESVYNFPNEMLFLLSNTYFFNLPYKYNAYAKEYELRNIQDKYGLDMKKYVKLLHFKCTIYKHLDIIRDNFLKKYEKSHPLLFYFLSQYVKTIYSKHANELNKITI
jgi:hypothetical protein